MTGRGILALSWCAVAMAATPAVAQTSAAAPPLPFEQKLAWVLRLEDQRVLRDPAPAPPPPPAVTGDRKAAPPVVAPVAPDLLQLLQDGEARMRRRAALAVGRVGLPEGVAPLGKLLASDPDGEVRAMAAFALGILGDRAAAAPLRAALADASALVQGRAAEALGLLGDAASAAPIAAMARAAYVQSNAITLNPHDQSTPLSPSAEAFRLGLFALTRLKAYDALASVVIDAEGEPRLRWWPVAYALSRVGDPRAAPALLTLARAGGSLSRGFAARGLGSLKDQGSVGTLLLMAQGWQDDPRSAVSAIRALGQIGSADAASGLRTLLQARTVSPTVRLEAVGALGALKDRESIDTVLELLNDPWPAMRAAALRAVRDIDPETFIVVLSGLEPDPHPGVRAALATMLAGIDPEIAQARLAAMLAEPDPVVLPAVIDALAGLPIRPPDFPATLARLLTHGDVIVRAAAARGIGAVKPESGAAALAQAYRAWQSDGLYQARLAALEALVTYGAAAAAPTLGAALADPDWVVRLKAGAMLRGLDSTRETAHAIRPAPVRAGEDYGRTALVAPAVSPHVFFETDRGTFEIELAVLDAPLTSANFLALAKQGYFSGVAIHRVVANFVVQDGDRRGDGEGSPGYSIRDELNLRPYLRGTVGMALDGADTGGSQWFITHSPQPHLDGKYTVFGHVVAGMDVVDRLQQWDVIRRVRTWDGVELVTR